MFLGKKDIATIRIHTQAIALLEQKKIIDIVYEEMEEVWYSLHTQDKKCPIIEQVATSVKRKLVQRYTIEFIKRMRNTIGLDLISKTIDPDSAYWVADDIVHRLSDNKTESHRGLFNALLVGVFGLSVNVIKLIEKENIVKKDLYDVLKKFYDLKVNDHEEDGVITTQDIKESLENYLNGGESNNKPLFEIDGIQ